MSARPLDANLLTSGFGDLVTVPSTPRLQTAAPYGLIPDHVKATSHGAGAVATAADASFIVRASAAVPGSWGLVWTKRPLRYKPGQALRVRITGRFGDGGAGASIQAAGALSVTDGFWVGRTGGVFGVTRRIAGAQAVYTLTITVGTTGATNATVTLDGVAFEVPLGAGLTPAQVAEALAASTIYTGWVSDASPEALGAVVTFVQDEPAATTPGSFSFAHVEAAGTFAVVNAGAPNDDVSGFVPQASFNRDRLDGSGDPSTNPSYVRLDPTKLYPYEILIPYLGAGAITFRVQAPSGVWVPFHTIEYPGSSEVPSQRNPAYRLGWLSRADPLVAPGVALEVSGVSVGGFEDGVGAALDESFPAAVSGALTATFRVLIALRVRGTFGGIASQVEAVALGLRGAVADNNRTLIVRALLNPTITGSLPWAIADPNSACDVAYPAAATASGGRPVDILVAGSGSGASIEFANTRIQPGDVLVVEARVASATASDTTVVLRWRENY